MRSKGPYQFVPDLKELMATELQTASAAENIQGQAIYSDSTVKILLFPFAAGQVLEEHVTPHPAILHVIQGEGELTLGPDRKSVREGAWAWIEGGLPHGIRADTKMILMLQVLLA